MCERGSGHWLLCGLYHDMGAEAQVATELVRLGELLGEFYCNLNERQEVLVYVSHPCPWH